MKGVERRWVGVWGEGRRKRGERWGRKCEERGKRKSGVGGEGR